jgi:hypothetical protein
MTVPQQGYRAPNARRAGEPLCPPSSQIITGLSYSGERSNLPAFPSLFYEFIEAKGKNFEYRPGLIKDSKCL